MVLLHYRTGNQYFNYPAIGLSWNIIDEPFMKDLTFLSNLKLRGGWGISGNRNVGAYATLGALSSGYYNFGTTTAWASTCLHSNKFTCQ